MAMRNAIIRLKQSPLFKDSMWSLIGSVLGQGLSLVAGIFVARFLGKDIYGEYGMIKTTLIDIAIFSTFGLGYTATKFVAESKQRDRQSVRYIAFGSVNITLVVSVMLSALLFIFANQVAVYLDAGHLALSLRIFAATIIFNALSTVQIGILAGFNEFKAIAKNKIVVGCVTFVMSVVLTWFWDIEGALSALLIANITNCILNNVVVRRQLKLYPAAEAKPTATLKKMIMFSLPLTLQEGVYSITSWLNILLLVKLSNYGEVGLYSAAMQWSAIILFIPGVLRNVTLSHLARTNDDASQHDRIFRRMIAVNFASTLIPCLIVFALSGFISSFYGKSFSGLPLILGVSVFTTIFSALHSVYIQEYMSMNRTWMHLYLSTFFNVLTLVAVYFLVKQNPERGAYFFVMTVLAISALRLLSYHLVMKYLKRKQ